MQLTTAKGLSHEKEFLMLKKKEETFLVTSRLGVKSWSGPGLGGHLHLPVCLTTYDEQEKHIGTVF